MTLAEQVRTQAEYCARAGSPLMRTLLHGAADDLDAGGPTSEVLGPLADDPPGSVPALRLAGALHRLVLERRAPLLATHYPSVGGTAPVEELWPAARAVLVEQREAMALLVRRPVQTNEVGRSAVLLGALQVLAAEQPLPVRLLEIGASAGLNLLADRYALRVQGRLRGLSDSPVVLEEPWEGDLPPDAPVQVVSRRGCDPDPLDPRSTDGRLTLTSYVWADQTLRLERLRGALAAAAVEPASVVQETASSFLEGELAERVAGVRTVVWQSVVRQYLSRPERAAVARVLAEAGARATPEAPLAHVALEPDPSSGAAGSFLVTATTWPGGRVAVLGRAQGHGPPVVWSRPRWEDGGS